MWEKRKMKSYHICLTRKGSCTYIIICGLISFSQFMDIYSLCLILNFFFQFCITNKWCWIDLTIFCWYLPCYSCSSSLHIPYFFSVTILFRLAWIRTCRCKKRTFSFMRGFLSVFTSEKICFKRDEKSKCFCCFFK